MNELSAYYKPKGMSSYDVLRYLKRKHKQRKIGFAGTLDVLAEGVLIIGFGKDTKKLGEMSDQDKEYIATVQFNGWSTTGDLEGRITKVKIDSDDFMNNIDEVVDSFIGKQKQTPSAFSAIHVKDGVTGKSVRSYELAREGRESDIKPRVITVQEIEILDLEPTFMEIRVVCSKGTYIRTLAEDIVTKLLGKPAGYLTKLVRTRVGDYCLDMCKKIE
jgi:tRNA pseudouridine55 synthase